MQLQRVVHCAMEKRSEAGTDLRNLEIVPLTIQCHTCNGLAFDLTYERLGTGSAIDWSIATQKDALLGSKVHWRRLQLYWGWRFWLYSAISLCVVHPFPAAGDGVGFGGGLHSFFWRNPCSCRVFSSSFGELSPPRIIHPGHRISNSFL